MCLPGTLAFSSRWASRILLVSGSSLDFPYEAWTLAFFFFIFFGLPVFAVEESALDLAWGYMSPRGQGTQIRSGPFLKCRANGVVLQGLDFRAGRPGQRRCFPSQANAYMT